MHNLAILNDLYIPQLYGIGFVDNEESEEQNGGLSFFLDPTLGKGYYRIFPVNNNVSITAMDITYHKNMEITLSQPEYLHFGYYMDGSNILLGYEAHNNLYHIQYPPNQRIYAIGVSMLSDYYKHDLTFRYDISPSVLSDAATRLNGSVMISDVVTVLKQLVSSKTFGNIRNIYCEGKVLELIAHITKWYRSSETYGFEVHPLDRKAIDEVMEYIKKNYNDNMSVISLCKVACMSRSKLSYIFKNVTGGTLSEYIKTIRLDMAQTLLRETSESIEQITQKIGFKGQAHFSYIFKGKYGITPLEYRHISKYGY
jgi:AraC-like DNA-binding protein